MKCFEDTANWPRWREALLDEWTKWASKFDVADAISKNEFEIYRRTAEIKSLIPTRWMNVVKYIGNRFKSMVTDFIS